MSANVFKALGPIWQIAQIGDASLCGTERYPIGLTAAQLMEWYWQSRTLNTSSGTVASAGTVNASFDGGVVERSLTSSSFDRFELVSQTTWLFDIPFTPQAFVTQNATVSVFSTAFNGKGLAFDGTLWYPEIELAINILIDDLAGNTATFFSTNLVDSTSFPNSDTATILGQSIPIGWELTGTGTFSGAFNSLAITSDTDWPYT